MLTAGRFRNSPCRIGKVRRCHALVIGLAFVNVAAIAGAQQYQTLPIDEKARPNRTIAQQCLRNPQLYAANKDKVADYFVNYYFPSMTRTEPDKLGEVGKLREELFKYFLWKTTNAELQHDLTDLAYKQAGRIVTADVPPCHPAARYNAILVIGLLDDQYSPDGRQPPKPYAPATQALTGVVNLATTDNRFPPPVILGAVIGLERHAQLHNALAPEAVSAMQAALLKLVTHKEPIQEMDRDAYAWLRLRAASALARLGAVGDKNSVHNAIMQLAVTNKSLDDRCEAVSLISGIDYKGAKLDDAGTAAPLFALARDIGATEDQRARDFQEHGAAAGGFSMPMRGPEGYGPGPGYAPDTGMTDPNAFPRRRTLTRLTELRTGLKQVKPALPAETQKKVDAVLAAINPVITAASSKDTVDLRLAESIRTMAGAINKAVPGPAKAEAEKAKDASAVF